MSDIDVEHEHCGQCNEKKELLLNGCCQECTHQLNDLAWDEEYWERMREANSRSEL